MKELFKRIITDFIEKEIKGIVPRAYNIPLVSKKVISLIGVRFDFGFAVAVHP